MSNRELDEIMLSIARLAFPGMGLDGLRVRLVEDRELLQIRERIQQAITDHAEDRIRSLQGGLFAD
jgi:hypothetical protein